MEEPTNETAQFCCRGHVLHHNTDAATAPVCQTNGDATVIQTALTCQTKWAANRPVMVGPMGPSIETVGPMSSNALPDIASKELIVATEKFIAGTTFAFNFLVFVFVFCFLLFMRICGSFFIHLITTDYEGM